MEEKEVIIRDGKREDCRELKNLIQDLANYLKYPNGPRIDHTVLEKDGFDTERPLFYTHVAEVNKEIIGFALYFYNYSTWYGKTMYLEDFYLKPEYRKKGVGFRLFNAVAKRAINDGCLKLIWMCFNWNPTQDFYLKLGATDITKSTGAHLFELTRNELEKLTNSSCN